MQNIWHTNNEGRGVSGGGGGPAMTDGGEASSALPPTESAVVFCFFKNVLSSL